MRISNLHVKQSNVYNLMQNNQHALKAQKKLITSKTFNQASEAPLKTITSLYTRIRINQLDRYQTNIQEARSQLRIAHDKVDTANNIVRRVRELAVQAANGPLHAEDRKIIAIEVEEMLQELIAIANSEYEDGYIFAGSKRNTKPFQVFNSFQNELGKTLVTKVLYQGDHLTKNIRIGDNDEAEILTNGGEIFWADRPTIISRTDSRNFINPTPATIRIDGFALELDAGDNLDVIIEKINAAVPTVTAFAQELPGGERTLAIEANFPHQVALEDLAGTTLLRTLGFLKSGAPGDVPYENLSANVIRDDGSIMDRIILLRNALIDNRIRDVGGIHLGGISRSLESLVKSQAKFSALTTRLDQTDHDLSIEKQAVIERRSAVEDTDIAEASIEFNEFDYLHKISLQTASRLLAPTLLDFL
ncbi:flagellar hook-associated protein 3 [Spirochaetota bacterium]|nr:flagellar hook-associated protein 3 [Spirochaetota bacterium]